MKYNILVANDDSIESPLLKPLVEVLKDYANNLLVVVPKTNQSACSQTIHVRNPIKVYEEPDIIEGIKTYSVDGSPADCVKIARGVLKYDFDLIVSGINDGYNLADDICYSGTVGAASEAEFYEKKGMAISIERGNIEGLKYLKDTLEYILSSNIYGNTSILNINIPPISKGFKQTIQGKRRFNETYIKTPDGTYQSVKCQSVDPTAPLFIVRDTDENSDYRVVENGYISITPISMDRTK